MKKSIILYDKTVEINPHDSTTLDAKGTSSKGIIESDL
jgi:hypothetical protein